MSRRAAVACGGGLFATALGVVVDVRVGWDPGPGRAETQDEGAWAQAAGNPSWLSVETWGFARRPLTAQQVDALARIYAWGMAQHGWPLEPASTPLGQGFGIHSMGGQDWGGHACPGPAPALSGPPRRGRCSARSV
ncbi:N-acetylmuramoyl-L-alanine amidase [Streptomyces sp. KS 21]|uniref:peptidoglycan recognition protein family protein n=1 Tax=Streptomyces sp. KS 21 TaxID=2485150 RepID=UPI001063EFE5|nr:N-acetylmuramoyl-L-alanine amidase [Streptomyces sp. KS 21]TDU73805.1 N-acetylmuramoyl-L-alanine amidase [Streptomyces sp. KS 21]